MTNAISTESQAVTNAEARLREAQDKRGSAQRQAHAARLNSANLQTRLTEGDTGVSIEDLIGAEPDAAALEALLPAYDVAIENLRQAVRVARTNEVVALLASGSIQSTADRSAVINRVKQQIADLLEPVEFELDE